MVLMLLNNTHDDVRIGIIYMPICFYLFNILHLGTNY